MSSTSFRYRSPRRCPSPNATSTGTASIVSVSLPKRAISAERKRSSTPPSPTSQSPSTPIHDTSAELLQASRKFLGNKLPEALWPSRMRSLTVSFQSDTFSLPISKREKTVSNVVCDRSLKPTSNVLQKKSDILPSSRKLTPERKRSPLKGKNSADQAENSKPVDCSLNTRLVEHQKWPSRIGSMVSSNAMSRNIDPSGKHNRSSSNTTTSASPFFRTSSLDVINEPLQKSTRDLISLVALDARVKAGSGIYSVDDVLERKDNPGARSQCHSTPGLRLPSPNRVVSSSSVYRGVSPSRTKSTPSRGPSPSRARSSSPSREPKDSTSVLSFIADIKKGEKVANLIEDAHQLRLLYNRYLQWRYANARADAALHLQKVQKEKTLYNVWRATSDLQDSVTFNKINLRKLRLKLKLSAVLNKQITHLDEWSSIERDHSSSLSGATQDLQACTLRLPITEGAKGDIKGLKEAVSSAVDVMQAMGSSICSILSRVEGMNSLVSELADIAAQERAMLDECEALLNSVIAMQVEECITRTHLIQLKQAMENQ